MRRAAEFRASLVDPQAEPWARVFVLLLLVFVVTAAIPDGQAAQAIASFFSAFVLVNLLYVRAMPPQFRPIVAGLLVAIVALVVADLVDPSETWKGWAAVVQAVLWLIAGIVILTRALGRRKISFQTVFAALSTYLVIGFAFTSAYVGIERLLDTQQFSVSAFDLGTSQYFSFVTLTTTGYGDITAVSDLSRPMAVVEALAGQVFLATAIARFVGLLGMGFTEPDDGSGLAEAEG